MKGGMKSLFHSFSNTKNIRKTDVENHIVEAKMKEK